MGGGRVSGRRGARFEYISDAASARDGVESGRVGWRVVAANNRPIGRSAGTFASPAECRDDARVLCKRVDETTRALQFDAGRGQWAWTVLLDSVPVAYGAHPFLRRVDCMRTLSLFLDGLRLGDPDAGEVRHFGPTSLRAYDPPARAGAR